MCEEKRIPTFIGVVYPDQVDHMGHMNVRHYVGMFDQATWVFFARMGITGRYMREAGVGMAAVAEHIEYRRELFPGDTVTVYTELLQVTNSSCQFKHTMTCEEDGEVAATAELTGVHINRSAHRSRPFPLEVRSAFEAILPTV
ncbi:MAG: acyl-CoA thioesterase [Acidimicrobiales bacterium]